MRGKDNFRHALINAGRITPAYAGKSGEIRAILKWIQDHPRVCGEKPVDMHSCTMTRGSPPRMRGKEGVGFHGV